MHTQRIVVSIMLSALLGFGSCGGASLSQPEPRVQRQPANTNSLRIDSLVRVADRPPVDSPNIAVQCANEEACWINTPRILWRSLDGGKTWQEVYRSASDNEVSTYYFISEDVGWSISFQSLSKSQDGGKSWTQLSSPLDYPNGEAWAIWFLSDGITGWLAGGLYRSQTTDELKSGVPPNTKDVMGKKVLEEAIYVTRNGGLSWETQVLPKEIGRILRIKFTNKDQGIAFGERDIYYTVNGGANWQKATLKRACTGKELFSEDYHAAPSNLFILDSATSWISYTDGRVLKSVDGGRTWCDLVVPGRIQFEPESNKPQYFTNLHFESSGHGWGLGWDRFLYETRDGGTNWTRVTSEVRFDSMAFPNKVNGFLVSEAGVFHIHP